VVEVKIGDGQKVWLVWGEAKIDERMVLYADKRLDIN
jgi:hypothetical protein